MLANAWQLLASFFSSLVLFDSTECIRDEQMSKRFVAIKCMCHVLVTHLSNVWSWWQADTTFVFFQIVFILFCSAATVVDWYADQVPRTCSCLHPDTRRSRVSSTDGGAVTADTWIKKECCKYLCKQICAASLAELWGFCGSAGGNWNQWVYRWKNS